MKLDESATRAKTAIYPNYESEDKENHYFFSLVFGKCLV